MMGFPAKYSYVSTLMDLNHPLPKLKAGTKRKINSTIYAAITREALGFSRSSPMRRRIKATSGPARPIKKLKIMMKRLYIPHGDQVFVQIEIGNPIGLGSISYPTRILCRILTGTLTTFLISWIDIVAHDMWPFNTSDKVTKGFQIGCQTSIDCIGRRIIIQHHVVNAHQLSKLEPFLASPMVFGIKAWNRIVYVTPQIASIISQVPIGFRSNHVFGQVSLIVSIPRRCSDEDSECPKNNLIASMPIPSRPQPFANALPSIVSQPQ